MMIAYTRLPDDDRYYHMDGRNGGATGCNLWAEHWQFQRDLPGLYLCGESPESPDEVEVMTGEPPTPEDGWRVGDEVLVRTVCHAGPQWLFRVYRLVAGEAGGASFGPVGRIAYGQRLY